MTVERSEQRLRPKFPDERLSVLPGRDSWPRQFRVEEVVASRPSMPRVASTIFFPASKRRVQGRDCVHTSSRGHKSMLARGFRKRRKCVKVADGAPDPLWEIANGTAGCEKVTHTGLFPAVRYWLNAVEHLFSLSRHFLASPFPPSRIYLQHPLTPSRSPCSLQSSPSSP